MEREEQGQRLNVSDRKRLWIWAFESKLTTRAAKVAFLTGLETQVTGDVGC